MKTKTMLATLAISFGLLTQALFAQQGPANGRGNARPDAAPIANPEECPFLVDGVCPGCLVNSPEDCPFAVDGTCPNGQFGPDGEWIGSQGTPRARLNPDAAPKLDGTGGRGQPANPDGPQDGTAPGVGYRGGRG
jgi:hypothetical protein